jgi:hypothetical protein
MIITEEFLERGGTISNSKTGAKSWRQAQFRLLGEVSSKGWKKRLIGQEISDSTARLFLELNPHRCELLPGYVSMPKQIVENETLKSKWTNLYTLMLKLKGEKFIKEIIKDVEDLSKQI